MRHTHRRSLSSAATPFIALTLVLGACTGGAAEPAASGAPAATNGTVPDGGASPTTAPDPAVDVPAAAPGEAVMVVEGETLAFTFNEYSRCDLDTEGEFQFRVDPTDGGPRVIAGGGFMSQRGWEGTIFAVVTTGANDEELVGQYEALLLGEGRTLVIEGNRLTYAGPITFKPPSAGNNPTSRPAGEGSIAVTCP